MKIEKQNPGFAKRVKSWLTGKYVENGSTASQNIPAGKWVIWKGQVCKAKTAITAGDTLSSANLDTSENGMINESLRWKFIQSVTGTTPVTIPSDANEVFVKVRCDNNDAVTIPFYLPTICCQSTFRSRIGYFDGASSCLCELKHTTTTVEIWAVMLSGSSKTGTSVMEVYYR